MAFFCKYCGKPLKEGARFCSSCGKELIRVRTCSCGAPLKEGAKFCVVCGKPVTAEDKVQAVTVEQPAQEPVKQAVTVEQPVQEPVKQAVTVEQPVQEPVQKQPMERMAPVSEERTETEAVPEEKIDKKAVDTPDKKGFWGMLLYEIRELLKHPKKLIPTIVLTVIWTILPLLMGFINGINIPAVRLFAALTYANGGIFGGYFGTVGGIFGKAVFAAVVNGIVLSICAKKNPFKGLKKGFTGVIGGGAKASAGFLIGGGVGFLLYYFFNVTSAPQNSAIAVVAAIGVLTAVAKQNGLIFAAVFFILKKMTKGKAPSQVSVNRVLSGLAAGFAGSFPVTFLRYPFLIALIGVLLIGCGIAIPTIFSAKAGKASQMKQK